MLYFQPLGSVQDTLQGRKDFYFWAIYVILSKLSKPSEPSKPPKLFKTPQTHKTLNLEKLPKTLKSSKFSKSQWIHAKHSSAGYARDNVLKFKSMMSIKFYLSCSKITFESESYMIVYFGSHFGQDCQGLFYVACLFCYHSFVIQNDDKNVIYHSILLKICEKICFGLM